MSTDLEFLASDYESIRLENIKCVAHCFHLSCISCVCFCNHLQSVWCL